MLRVLKRKVMLKMLNELVDVYANCIGQALPVTMVFFIGNLITSTILTAAFGGKFTFGR